MRRGRDLRLNGRLALVVVLGLGVALAVLEYGSATGSASSAKQHGVGTAGAVMVPLAAESAAKSKKLQKALAACKKEKPKSKRKKCEKKAKKRYGKKPTKEPGNVVPTEKPKTTESPEQEMARAKTVESTPPTAANVAAGKTLFANENCANCHGPAGNGTAAGPNLHVMPRAQSVTGVMEQLIQPEGSMPSFDKTLSFSEKEQVADYVAVEITKKVTAAQPGF
jgi:mono/diheme cytochrome c family protein